MKPTVLEHHEENLSLSKYTIGFLLSITLTLLAYLLVTRVSGSNDLVIGVISVLAVVQFVVQMLFFLHLGDERKPRWKLGVLALMLGVVLIVVVGSLWIMNNLNYRMTPQQMDQYMRSQDSL
jgi:cytochrome o ubiquinol oxidase operon protein cyoD